MGKIRDLICLFLIIILNNAYAGCPVSQEFVIQKFQEQRSLIPSLTQGPPGPQGPTGSQGIAGVQGPKGPQGNPGPAAELILTSTPCTEGDARCGVFVSRMRMNGAMVISNPDLAAAGSIMQGNGRNTADQVCNFEGKLSAPNHEWRAWLSNDDGPEMNARRHATQENTNYFRSGTGMYLGGRAADEGGVPTGTLFSGHIGNSISGAGNNIQNPTADQPVEGVWTGTLIDGTAQPPQIAGIPPVLQSRTCNSWGGGVASRPGIASYIDFRWTRRDTLVTCDNHFPVYCFQQKLPS